MSKEAELKELCRVGKYEPLTDILNKSLMIIVNNQAGIRRKLVHLRKLLKAFEGRIDK